MGAVILCDSSVRTTTGNSSYQACGGTARGWFAASEDEGDPGAPVHAGADWVAFVFGDEWHLVGRSDDTDNGPFTSNPAGTKTGTLGFKTPQTGFFVLWLQGVEVSAGNAWHSVYLYDAAMVGSVSAVLWDTKGIQRTTGGANEPNLAFAALFHLGPPVTSDPGSALRMEYRMRLQPSQVPTEPAEVQFDVWIADDLDAAATASDSSPHHALDLQLRPVDPGNWSRVEGMTIDSVAIVASGVADPSAAAAGLPAPSGVVGTHYRVQATYTAGAAFAEWRPLIGSAAVDDPTTDNPWPGADPLDRTVAAFDVRVAGVPVAGQVHRRAIVNV